MKQDSGGRTIPLLARVQAGATFLLLIAGALVTSTDSGLSVPDWPTSYGWNMFTFPISKWVGGIRFEHTHRLIASLVGLLAVVFFLLVIRSERSRALKVLSGVGVAAVVAQGILGGLTVRYLLPTPISVAHACLAQSYFCLTIALVIMTSSEWRESALAAESGRAERAGEGTGERVWTLAAFAAVYVQLILGAWMRHSGAGRAIPDFPSSFGRLVPDRWDGKIAIAFSHRAWAVVAVGLVATASVQVLRGSKSGLARFASAAALLLLPVQVLLGAASVWMRGAVSATVAHVAVGALLLAMSVQMALGVFRESWMSARLEAVVLPAPRAAGAL